MALDRWRRVKELVEAAGAREAYERAVFLDEARAGEPALRPEVETLLQYEDRATRFLEVPGPGEVAGLLQARDAQSLIGQRIGHFTFPKVLGYGGMGVVHLTRRALPEAVRAICDRPPPRLSTIDRTLQGDLETIVGKAREKEKPRRYQPAAQLLTQSRDKPEKAAESERGCRNQASADRPSLRQSLKPTGTEH